MIRLADFIRIGTFPAVPVNLGPVHDGRTPPQAPLGDGRQQFPAELEKSIHLQFGFSCSPVPTEPII